jgi:hypothetical protein
MIGVIALEAARMFLRRLRVSLRGIRKYSGSAEEICVRIVRDCYNKEKKYFMTSNGHFSQFYCRDFGWCTEALLSLGYRKEVISTLEYALGVFQQHGRIEQSISPSGKPFTFPLGRYSPDALAFLVLSLRLVRAGGLVKKYERFLNKEIKRYYELVIDERTGLVRKDEHFSSIKDYALRKSSCYDNCMTALLANCLSGLGLDNPFKKHNYKKLILKKFWNGSYFLDDLSGDKRVCGDANFIPFWTGLLDDKGMMRKAVASVRREGLDKPFPLKYTNKKFKQQKMIGLEWLAGDYERGSVGAHLGMMFIRVVGMLDKKLARLYLAKYKKQIEHYKNFLEVYDKDGKPFKTLLYYSDESMLWAANYLFLKGLLS